MALITYRMGSFIPSLSVALWHLAFLKWGIALVGNMT